MAAQTWSDAEDAAVEGGCAGWTDDKKPVTSAMELLEDPETQLADRKTALAKLRLLTDAADGIGEFLDSEVGTPCT
ncbi:hypothetical protein NKJ66_27155 [Mesorhizobium sp. M0078]|uniref:hypothetical protein n=1 Tax=Mesorhizobium sp. M0078 TaxID=2956871 RepID=UPI00333AE390